MPKKKTTRSSRSRRATRSRSTETTQMRSAMAASRPSTPSVSNARFNFAQLVAMFVGTFIVNSVVIYVANLLFPGDVVLGNHVVDKWSAIVTSMLILTVIDVGAIPVIETAASIMNRRLSVRDWMILYFIINAGGLWFIARMAEMIGLGVSSWLVVVVLGLIMDVLQGLVSAKVATMRR